MALDRNSILSAGRLKTETVALENGDVIVSEIGGADYIKLWSDPANREGDSINMSRFTPALISYSVVDETGKRIFTDADIDAIARLSQGPFLKIAEVARKLNGMSGEEVKNSEAAKSEDFSSASA